VSQPAPQPSWKQEVNRRLEAHKSRKGLSVVDQGVPSEEHGGVSDRALKAAARVAARFSKAPSYSEMQAAEARAALRDAEAATRAALEAQAAAQAALANLEAAEEEYKGFVEQSQVLETEQSQSPTRRDSATTTASKPLAVRWDPDLPLRAADPPPSGRRKAEASSDDRRTAAVDVGVSRTEQPVEIVEPIHANLIQFPRELVATRRLRPRLAGTPPSTAEEQHGQLSIFEVDPNSISIDPTASVADAASSVPSWSGPEWSNIELDAQPEEKREFHGDPPSTSSGPQLAPLELRLMAGTIDFALILGLVCAGAAGVAEHMQHALGVRAAEISGIAALILTGILYQAFFLLVTMSTPGMMYAGIALCTFDDEQPTRAQLRDRLGALLVSLLPVGLGMAWSIFDEEHLSWHDRLSRTYQRKC
jgi:uncharacterized RDD family membrane protein YckC